MNTKFLIGQRVILTLPGGTKEIGTVVPPEAKGLEGVWVMSPTRGYASAYAELSIKPLPNGQL